ncbi:hypothetical protein [Acidithiobacillus caldus]|uniref:Uncharacterized protein n=1 Tax=Acidithiobacillus caldus (strain ATCC 51756 / DSM 8584 / KU) TaxID=637389 RepID=A0A060A355_ACICK|nr:hypothetical protein [Acidithiobacillus caldus]AIA56636.1 hypothetical protein Acaty_m0063 [Acidithiobacillus caldus ATCC 51756]MBU2729244.1 hypothetical protein [Acidithiobacillus caldus]MBU2744296.1 hypothetical protein [Acidithiobacillus caldus]MBU2781332.1 hypothetical protein [Acidithiobacillus caldus]
MTIIVVSAIALSLVVGRLFYGLIRWESRWDIRILELGFHCFLLGILLTLIDMAWMGWMIL